jgi:DMSO/TMAO reductase YedYZ molybdopterin-dependent catalytic subunit
MTIEDPFVRRAYREHTNEAFAAWEVALANRNSGLPLEMLRHDVTPLGAHYLLTHFDVPFVADASTWSLQVKGRVKTPLTLSLADLQELPAKTLRVTLECAGNGRSLISPRYQSMPWRHEAVSTAEWTGASLHHVLDRVGLAADAVDVSFLGADRGVDNGNEHNFGRSLKPDAARNPDVMLVWAMNGQPLLPQHGAPLRLIVPGWYGMASVKWLDTIEVLDRPFEGYQQTPGYHFRQERGEHGTPITLMRPRALMIPPGIPDWSSRARRLGPGTVAMLGRAWSGGGVPIVRVEFAVDGIWQDATLDPPSHSPYAWRSWRTSWIATPGVHELACRATDANGATQPLEARWDNGGFGNNGVQRVKVWVTA